MAAFLTTSSVLMCPHGGTVTIISSNTQVMAGGDFLVRASDTFIIAGVPVHHRFGTAPPACSCSGCNRPRTGQAAAVTSHSPKRSVGCALCVAVDQAVQGTVLVTVTQEQVAGQ